MAFWGRGSFLDSCWQFPTGDVEAESIHWDGLREQPGWWALSLLGRLWDFPLVSFHLQNCSFLSMKCFLLQKPTVAPVFLVTTSSLLLLWIWSNFFD